ncbi:hypothetical protein [Streptomyces platensis]
MLVGVLTAAPDAVCAHDEAHPPAYPDSQAHLNHLYAPAEFAAPESPGRRGAWGCPRYPAGLAEEALDTLA